ncbi:daxx-like protein isoform X2 [Hylaeus anthracinus]|uniref:daxx-like protein isoform X2 n=2 Tax=Hylaeus anthracinus TaxID=313031 RepID=UPI0023BA07F1|nr:daxx-like protein isoform X2 [Hylaeus anthracinus]
MRQCLEVTNMEKDEVICISSDDDEETAKNESNGKGASKQTENLEDSQMKVEVEGNNNEKVATCGIKRSVSDMNDSPDADFQKTAKVFVCERDYKARSPTAGQSSDEHTNVQENGAESQIPKPKLIVKEKKVCPPVAQDIFPMFLSLCLHKDRSDEMKVITNRLKRRYEQLDPAYANSEAFLTFLNEKRNDIMNKTQLYVHIIEVMNVMKSNRKNTSSPLLNGSDQNAGCSNSDAVNNNEDETEQDEYASSPKRKSIKKLLKAMKQCEKGIKKLEESEINFDEENNSSYMKLERYRYRMVELYNKLCEYTGENADAGRQYLRPKHLSTTGIVAVDHAITSFINSKISKRNKLKKVGAFADALIFPDYSDILQCVATCNESRQLGLDNKKQQQLAKKAFTELGEYLQRSRRNDYWDTFSLFLENSGDDDPALKDPELAQKLMQNKKEGEKRLTNVFQEYVKKQEEMKDDATDTKTSSENEEDVENSSDSDEEDTDNENMKDDVSSRLNKDKSIADEDETSLDNAKVTAKRNTETADKSSKSIDRADFDIMDVDDASDKLKDVNGDSSKATNSVANIPKCVRNSESQAASKDDTTKPLPNLTLSTNVDNEILIHKTKEDEANIIREEESTDNVRLEEEKPLLRVRSFAKPPTTWADVHEKADKSTIGHGTVINNGIVDLTGETLNQNSNLAKCKTIQIGSKVLPLVKSKFKTLVIPAGKSIIKVKNITNNYVRLNSQDIDLSNAAKLQKGQAISLHKVVDRNRDSTIVHLQSNNQQSNAGNQAKNLLTKQNGPIIRIPPPGQTILLTAKQKESLQSLTANSSKSKPT